MSMERPPAGNEFVGLERLAKVLVSALRDAFGAVFTERER